MDAKVRLDVKRVVIQGKNAPILELFEYMDEQFERLEKVLLNESVLKLSYEEDLLSDPTVGYKKVCSWMGLQAYPVNVTLKRTNTRALTEVLENWDEVAACLEGTSYAWMLHDSEG